VLNVLCANDFSKKIFKGTEGTEGTDKQNQYKKIESTKSTKSTKNNNANKKSVPFVPCTVQFSKKNSDFLVNEERIIDLTNLIKEN
jgi:hypothetical protein